MPEALRKNLQPLEYCSSTVEHMDILYFYNGKQCVPIWSQTKSQYNLKIISDSTITRSLGYSRLERREIFLYYFSQRRKIDKEISIYRWFFHTLRCHHPELHIHLLHRSKATAQA